MNLKRLLVGMLAIVMMLSMSVMAFAADEADDDEDLIEAEVDATDDDATDDATDDAADTATNPSTGASSAMTYLTVMGVALVLVGGGAAVSKKIKA